jgi:imidazolonepropionase-like amidohydrolase
MREHGVALCPTLAASEAMARYAGWVPSAPDPPRIKRAKDMFARALRSGVTIACGSDVGVFSHGDNARELELMVEYGMSPTDALKSATITAAAVLRRSSDLGRVAEGYVADLVAVRGDPLHDISVLRNVMLVIKEGKVAFDKRTER